MLEILNLVIPFFCAYFLKRLKIFKESDVEPLINYTIYFAIPAISFKTAHNIEVNFSLIKVILSAWGTNLLLIGTGYIVGTRLLKFKERDLRLFLLMIAFGNTGFLGYPYAHSYFGEKGLEIAVIYDSLGNFIMVLTLGLFIAVGKMKPKEFFAFPPSWALILGLLLKPFPIPPQINRLLDFVIPSIFPVIMFALGLAVNLGEIKYFFKKSLFIEVIKILGGALAGLLVSKMLLLSGIPLKVCILLSSMPTMVFTSVLAIKYKLNVNLAISSISLGIILSFIITPGIIFLINHLL